MPEKSSRRVMATSVLFLIELLAVRRLEFFCVGAVGLDPRHASFVAALEFLRRNPSGAADGSGDCAYQGCGAEFYLTVGAVNRRVGIGRSRKMDGHSGQRAHTPDHAFFGAAYAGYSHADWPHARDFVELAGGAGGVRDRSFATELVEAPAFAMAFVAECQCIAAGVEVCAARAVVMNHALVGEFGAAEFVERRKLAHSDVLENYGQQVIRVGRATGQIDDRLAGEH